MLGSTFWDPGSELIGRRPIFIGTLTIHINQARANDMTTLLVTRFLCGFFAVAPLTNSMPPVPSSNEVCGVSQGSAALECLNTDTALESCGGCVSPNPFLMSEQGPEGIYCVALPCVQNVRCSASRFVVQACVNGYVPSSDYSACIRDTAIFVQPAHV
ncbi:hypothetical protein BC826DRAFT_1177397 [Russula brevipes]|nr:hypothetical protein BC826DRAFT_1177397 [Russula brevipes]